MSIFESILYNCFIAVFILAPLYLLIGIVSKENLGQKDKFPDCFLWLCADSHYGALLALFLLEDRESSQIFEALRSVTTSPQNLTPESLLLIASRGYVKLTVKNGLFDSLRIALLRISKLDLGHQSPIETWHQVLLPVLASQLSSSGDQVFFQVPESAFKFKSNRAEISQKYWISCVKIDICFNTIFPWLILVIE